MYKLSRRGSTCIWLRWIQCLRPEKAKTMQPIWQRRRRITNYWSDGLGTYTPPGHWNGNCHSIIVEQKLNPIRTARILAYMNMAIMDGGISCWDAKYYYHYQDLFKNIAGFKNHHGHSIFPSLYLGHGVFSAAAADVLASSFHHMQSVNEMAKWSCGILCRSMEGIHWAFDASCKLTQGKAVAKYSIDLAKKDSCWIMHFSHN